MPEEEISRRKQYNRDTFTCKTNYSNQCSDSLFFCGSEGSRSRCYGPTAALRLIVQPCDEDEEKGVNFFFFSFSL